ncbi:MAG: hypothetical protein Q9209_005505 [Squamulea sp. 1 TL-2023]
MAEQGLDGTVRNLNDCRDLTVEQAFQDPRRDQQEAWSGQQIDEKIQDLPEEDCSWGLDSAERADSDDKVYESRYSLSPRLHELRSSLIGILKHRGAWFGRRQVYEVSIGRSYDQDDNEAYQDNEWPQIERTVQSRISALAIKLKVSVKQRIRRLRGHETYEDTEEEDSDAEHRYRGWDDWGYEYYANNNREVAEVPKYLEFTDPVPNKPSENACLLSAGDFLSRFLSARRLVNIHPERKHGLAVFLATICEEASFDHVSFHAPARLVLLRVDTPDRLELQDWVDLVWRLRQMKEVPDDAKPWPDARTWFESYRVEEALQELYDDECGRTSKSTSLNIYTTDQVLVPAYIQHHVHQEDTVGLLSDEGTSKDSSLTLVSSESHKGSAVSVEEPPAQGEVPTNEVSSNDVADTAPLDTPTAIFPADVRCTPLIAKYLSITTCNQCITSYQDILEHCLFKFDWRGCAPDHRCCAIPCELSAYVCHNIVYRLWRAFPGHSRGHVWDLLRRAQDIRNIATHRDLCEPEGADWFGKDALDLATFVEDDDAARKIRLTTWVADLNLGLRVKRDNERLSRSALDWKRLEQDARAWLKSSGEDLEKDDD